MKREVMNEIFFSGWQPVLRILIVSVLAYVTLVAALRVSGKRTPSYWRQMAA